MTNLAHHDDPDECDYCGKPHTRIYGDFAICSGCRAKELGLMLLRGVKGAGPAPGIKSESCEKGDALTLEALCEGCDTYVPVTWLREVSTCGGGRLCGDCADREHTADEAAESDYGPGAIDEHEAWK